MIQQVYKYVRSSLWACGTFFEAKITTIEIKWVGTWKEWVAMGTEIFMTKGVFSAELLAYQVSL